MKWNLLQEEIASCSLCREKFPGVECPPGKLYPPADRLPKQVKVLFVGVAPPKKARHFYTGPDDNLRRGLFDVLNRLGWPCDNISEFLGHGFFLLHTAKCAIKGTTKPSVRVSRFCTSHHLKREIEQLLPIGICWLSKEVGYEVCQMLSQEWQPGLKIPFGKVTPIMIKDKEVQLLATKWPGRGWKNETYSHLEKLLKVLINAGKGG